MHVMLDLETMGRDQTAPIVAIGACRFDENGVADKFYRAIDLRSAVRYGAEIDADTVLWWLQQEDAARAELVSADGNMLVALIEFRDWLSQVALSGMWGNGAGFDNAILAAAYRRNGMDVPWPFWLDRCYRTVKADFDGVLPEREGTHHHAMDDAVHQARCLIHIWGTR